MNESVDDQRLIYWTKWCLESETTSKKTEYEKCLKVVIFPPLTVGTSSDVFEQAESGECCSTYDISTWCTHQQGRGTSTQKLNLQIDNENTEVWVKRAFCEGVNVVLMKVAITLLVTDKEETMQRPRFQSQAQANW